MARTPENTKRDESVEDDCCMRCYQFESDAARHDQPYPEFWCSKGHWEGVTDMDDLWKPVICPDFKEVLRGIIEE